ncbi:type I-F CRISPR-associated endoribonuclease Cas6/Csy4 [Legionella longbeachae]|uniref:type I-F CRISPR-associated endoribonuclease Cas6/Csy4 n=1 Tax=Legionella longbeachae TaxID=450 RepID=UPI0014053BDD|nr:type I-F CRISPR-associated endoribonuclease Cas6/Csy4 [Legionella longbeachae]QIN30672.1 type I-F CRISPR-associated endoribonuclease Cas6/Csy4 [Legionella longbeachae]
MNYYIDILINPDSELCLNFLLNTVYTKFHKALYDLASTNIGISFPKYNVTLGNVLRIHGGTAVLHDLQSLKWLGGMSGYCDISPIIPVPTDTKFRTISRKQTTMSQSKLRRLIKRGSIMEGEIKQYKAKMFSKGLDNPYVELVSGSNAQKHRRYIEFGELVDQPIPGEFDQFGLSKTGTVPWFD